MGIWDNQSNQLGSGTSGLGGRVSESGGVLGHHLPSASGLKDWCSLTPLPLAASTQLRDHRPSSNALLSVYADTVPLAVRNQLQQITAFTNSYTNLLRFRSNAFGRKS